LTTATPSFVLDSFALLALFRAEAGGPRVRQLLEQADDGRIRLAMTVVNLGEVVYRTIREQGIEGAEQAQARIQQLAIAIVDVDRELALAAARLKGAFGLGYADCFVAALAQRLGATLATGDSDFRKVEGVVTIEWLPT